MTGVKDPKTERALTAPPGDKLTDQRLDRSPKRYREVSPTSILEGPGNPEDRYIGVRLLWLKVIQRAMFDWVIYRDSTRLEDKKKGESAYNWLFKPSVLHNGLESVCAFCNIDADEIRARARKMDRRDVVKMEHLERGPALPASANRVSMVVTGEPNVYPRNHNHSGIIEESYVEDVGNDEDR